MPEEVLVTVAAEPPILAEIEPLSRAKEVPKRKPVELVMSPLVRVTAPTWLVNPPRASVPPLTRRVEASPKVSVPKALRVPAETVVEPE